MVFFRYAIQCAVAVLQVASLLIIRVVFICFDLLLGLVRCVPIRPEDADCPCQKCVTFIPFIRVTPCARRVDSWRYGEHHSKWTRDYRGLYLQKCISPWTCLASRGSPSVKNKTIVYEDFWKIWLLSVLYADNIWFWCVDVLCRVAFVNCNSFRYPCDTWIRWVVCGVSILRCDSVVRLIV